MQKENRGRDLHYYMMHDLLGGMSVITKIQFQ